MDNKIPLIVVCGPTASGKTALAVELAKLYNGEVVSADSMQIYKGMSIATAKPTAEEMQGIAHHLIDFVEPDVKFSVADYLPLARECISDIYSRGKQPIICGGTGLYISSLINNVRFEEIKSDPQLRARLEAEYKELGAHAMWQRLLEIDPETANSVHENNVPRVIRGIEAYMLTGKQLSQLRKESITEESDYKSCIIGLGFKDRAVLYDRINRRVDIMIEDGLIEECRSVYESCTLETACQAIGYKELIPYFKGEKPLDECVELIKQETRHYAKRQLTWFRRMEGINWVDPSESSDFENFLRNVQKIVAKTIFL
ncbi:tRNA (adenosine(37)-N6)-dimethylallyltransferase MiaA [Ruminococcus sp. NK3A76]|uniref:tRNA (adenosine(37)-N6)-dimethylallyltransferase MiaA n=1 Tax=Ruminococcus sp. NK3A76 TaxID=877411 RepID=UPI00049156D2|nr:tRNA (adenosine(37)-N6)-dimethylallyltransferase MiaA [Ruminococcus sp. NK3A76]